jgi:hypothetical protein
MTTIAGAQHKAGCVIAADSQTTWGERPFNSFGVDKVIEKNGYLFAVAGDGRAADILNHAWKPPKITATGDLYGFMVAKVVPSIRKALADGGWKDSSESKDDSGIDALIAIRGQLFSIASDFTVLRGVLKEIEIRYSGGVVASSQQGDVCRKQRTQQQKAATEAAMKKKSINTDAFNVGFKYGKGEITKAEADKLLKKSRTSGASVTDKISASLGYQSTIKKLTPRTNRSAASGMSAAKQEKAAIARNYQKRGPAINKLLRLIRSLAQKRRLSNYGLKEKKENGPK